MTKVGNCIRRWIPSGFGCLRLLFDFMGPRAARTRKPFGNTHGFLDPLKAEQIFFHLETRGTFFRDYLIQDLISLHKCSALSFSPQRVEHHAAV